MRRETRHAAGVDLSVLVWDAVSPAHPPVVLLPGTGLTAENWSEVAADLSRDRTVRAVDLRGHGGSDRPGTYSVELMTADVLALLASMGEESDVVGHSLGGLVACRVAARSPLVRRLVLEDVGLLRPRMPAAPVRPDGDLAFDWAVVEQVRPEVDTPAADWPKVLAGIAAPVLAVGGGPTSFVPQEWVDDLVAVVPRATTVTIDVGHEVHAARPREFLDAVRAFLDADEVDSAS
ncbi:alpha/beta fold hydrolase [Knoellia sp. CPCC 206450]|uniref:alpha/beta fold hydrolase n=1 Tax=Knoellia tibetensis TaxID=3404798 RepID=UPI003B436EE2